MILSITVLYHFDVHHFAECRVLFIVLLIVVMLSFIMLHVVILNVLAP
jgi:hypothetical protein